MTQCYRVLPRLYQGPLTGSLPSAFTMIVLCAEELQPPDGSVGRLRIVRCPLRDELSTLPRETLTRALNAASIVCAEHGRGGRVYVSCAAGINRSGLVMALAVRQMLRVSGAEAMRWVQERRPGALINTEFQRVLTSLGAPVTRA